MRSFVGLAFVSMLAVSLAGCSDGGDDPSGGGPIDNDVPLSDLDALMTDAPSNAKLDELGKADANYPKLYTDLLALQTPVKNQARRGVCSIFATIGLMEHLYVKQGQLPNPDFSEQFLQWSAKVEADEFSWTEGSSAQANLRAISEFGLVAEEAWPYQPDKWTSANDPECTGGESQPVKCFTNGDPPATALAAPRFKLPAGRFVNSKTNSIKAFMFTKKQAVTVGLTFFYQAWNHRLSPLPTDSATYWKKGFVFNPNAKDRSESLKKRAGHAIVLVGWDDDAEVQPLDETGKPAVDASGAPIMEKGFFIFKNSWGTDRFGTENPYGPGYGYISYKYVEDHGTVYGSDVPKPVAAKEVCNDGTDNDNDAQVDCQDGDCAADPACASGGTEYVNSTAAPIPDGNTTGVKSDIVVPEGGTVAAVSVTVDISHEYRGDLIVKLVRQGGGEAILHDREGGSGDDIKKTFTVAGFSGQDAAGTWSLVAIDKVKPDAGVINSWKLSITRCTTCSAGTVYTSTVGKPIPDDDASGVASDIQVPESGKVKSISVTVSATHSQKGDLALKLQKIGLGEVVLQEADASVGAFEKRTFSVTQLVGEEGKGTWRLVVADTSPGDTGTLDGWSLELAR